VSTGIANINSTTAGRALGPDARLRAKSTLQRLADRFKGVQPGTFLNTLLDRIRAENRYVDLQRVRVWKRNVDFYLGNQDGHWDNRTGFWVPNSPDPDNPIHANNQYGFFVRSVAAMAGRSQAQFKVRARTDDPQLVGAAKVADVVQKDWWRRRWKASHRQMESKYSQLTGNYLRNFNWSMKGGVPALIPKTEQIQIAGEEEGYQCNECGTFGPTETNSGGGFTTAGAALGQARPPLDNGLCPTCGSEDIYQMGLPALSMNVVTGHQQIDSGDLIADAVDPMEGKLHLHSRFFETSPYFIRRRLFLQEVLEDHFPFAEMSRSTASSDLILMYQRSLEASNGGGSYSVFNDSYHDMVEFEEAWLAPAMYSFYITPDEVAGDVEFPTKTQLRELYPDGMYLGRIGNQIVQERAEDKNDWWVHGRFDIVPNSVWGRGQDDAVSQNEQLNEAESLWYEILMHHASRKTAYNPLKYNAEDITGSPRDLMELQNAQEDDRPGEYIWESPGGGATPDLPAFIEKKQSNMQHQFSAFDAFVGDSGGRSEPATRTAILRDQNNILHGPTLDLKAEADMHTTEIVLREKQKNWVGVQYHFMGGQYDDQEGQWFGRSDIQGDFELWEVPGSSEVQSVADQRATIIDAGNWGSLPGGIFSDPVRSQPKLFNYLLEQYGLSFDAGDVAPDYRKQRLEIKQLEDMLPHVLEAFAAQGIPEQLPPGMPLPDGSTSQEPMPHPMVVQFLASKIKPEFIVDNDDVHIQTIVEWRKTDQGMKCRPVMWAALEAHIMAHVDNKVKVQQFMGEKAIEAQAAQMALQEAQANADAERQAQGKGDGKPGSGKQGSSSPAANAGRQQRHLPTRSAGQQQAGASPTAK